MPDLKLFVPLGSPECSDLAVIESYEENALREADARAENRQEPWVLERETYKCNKELISLKRFTVPGPVNAFITVMQFGYWKYSPWNTFCMYKDTTN